MRETIKEGLASISWRMAWSNHAEEHRCANLSGARIEEIAPKVPAEILERAEEALQKIEARIGAPIEGSIAQDAIEWLREYSEPAHVDAICIEAGASPVIAALISAAKADALADQDPEAAEFEEPTSEALNLLEDPEYARRFGECLGYAIAGAGVSWSDDHADVPLPDLYYCSDINDRARDIAESTCEHNKPESEED